MVSSETLFKNTSFWNVGGWSKFNNDNFIFREDVILANDCDLFCVCETFLSHNEILKLNGYKSIGHNRKQRHSRAKRGSGGVGMFIKRSFLDSFRYEYCVLDNKYEDILWVKFWNNDSSFCVCVCYLPPDGSSRRNDAEESIPD